MNHTPHIKSIILLLVGCITLCSFNNTSESTSAAYYISNSDTLPCFLVISDIHLRSGIYKQENASGDSSDSLWHSTMNEINKIRNNNHPDFLIILGDFPFHAHCNSKSGIQEANKSFDTVLRNLVTLAQQTKIPFIIVPGNNDSWEGDYKKFSLPDSFFNTCKYPFIDFSEKDSVEKAALIDKVHLKEGYYSVYPIGRKKTLRIVVLNTTTFIKDDSCAYDGDQNADAAKQMQWFENQLKDATSLKEHVLIAMHIPPGIDAYKTFDTETNPNHNEIYTWTYRSIQNNFLDLIHNYQNNIVGVLTSHTHMDGIKLLRNTKADSVTSLLISVPGIAPGHGNNPALKLIHYNDGNFALQDFTTYYMNYWNECQNKRNSNCHEKITTWSDSFNFPKPGTNLSILQYFQQKQVGQKQTEINQSVNDIYSAYGKSQDSNQVNASIYIDYQK